LIDEPLNQWISIDDGTGHAEAIHGLTIWDNGELPAEHMHGKLQPRRRYARLKIKQEAAARGHFRRSAWSLAAGGG
jgi:hypothetical protein